MIKGRLFVVNDDSYNETIKTNIASIYMPDPKGDMWVKTISDIMADMLQIQIGDYIFLWQTKNGDQKSRIHGVYRAISKPYFDNSVANDTCPFKIKIERAYEFKTPIDEYDLLTCPYMKGQSWTVMGKKVANKPRGTSPLSLEEMDAIIKLLIGSNEYYKFIPFDSKRVISVKNELKVNYALRKPNITNPTRDVIDANLLTYFDSKNNVLYEKTIETIFNMEIANHNCALFNQLGINLNKVIWYANYLPYSLEGSEMDYVIIESEDGITYSKIYLLEFLVKNPDASHIKRSAMYAKWINEAMALGTNITKPIIICKNSVDFLNGETSPSKSAKINSLNSEINDAIKKYQTRDIEIYKYDFLTTGPVFTRKR